MSDLAEKHGKASIADGALSASAAAAVATKQTYISVDCFVFGKFLVCNQHSGNKSGDIVWTCGDS